jgi:hypothetical protein
MLPVSLVAKIMDEKNIGSLLLDEGSIERDRWSINGQKIPEIGLHSVSLPLSEPVNQPRCTTRCPCMVGVS